MKILTPLAWLAALLLLSAALVIDHAGCGGEAEAHHPPMHRVSAGGSADAGFPDSGIWPDAAFQLDMTRGAELWMETYTAVHMSSQSSTVSGGAYTAHPAAIGDRVGNIADPVNGHAIEAGTAITRPALVAPTSIASAVQFGLANIERFVVQNSGGTRGPVNFVHESGVGWIALWYRKDGSDASNRAIVDNANWSGANRGHSIACTSANRYQFEVMSPGGGNFMFNYTSGAGLPCTVAAGERKLIVTFNGASGGTFYSCAGSATTLASCSSENFSFLKAPATGAPFSNLTIGAIGAGTSGCNCTIGNLFYGHYVPTTAEVETWMGTNPDFSTSASLVRTTTAGCGYNFCMGAWDFTSVAGKYQTTACGTAVSASGDPIACAVPANDLGTYARHLNRDLIVDVIGDAPTYQGASGARFDGVDDSFSAISGSASGMRHGIGFSLLASSTCNDTSNGCHLAIAATQHFVRSGSGYSTPHVWILHTALGTIFSTDGPLANGGGAGTLECITAYRDGRTWAGQAQGAAAGTPYAQGMAGGWYMTRSGDPSIANWNMDGDYRRLILVNATIPNIVASCP